MVGGQFVPDRYQCGWSLIMHSPDVNVAVGHQHVQLSLCQVSSGEWKIIVRPKLQMG